MTWEQKLAALNDLCPTRLETVDLGMWVVAATGREIKRSGHPFLTSVGGMGRSQKAAVEDDWGKITSLPDGYYVVIDADEPTRRHVRWNGSAWQDVSDVYPIPVGPPSDDEPSHAEPQGADAHPLAVGLRNEEITEAEFDALCEIAENPDAAASGVLRREPKRIPLRTAEPELLSPEERCRLGAIFSQFAEIERKVLLDCLRYGVQEGEPCPYKTDDSQKLFTSWRLLDALEVLDGSAGDRERIVRRLAHAKVNRIVDALLKSPLNPNAVTGQTEEVILSGGYGHGQVLEIQAGLDMIEVPYLNLGLPMPRECDPPSIRRGIVDVYIRSQKRDASGRYKFHHLTRRDG